MSVADDEIRKIIDHADRADRDRKALLAGLGRLALHCANDETALEIIAETLRAMTVAA